MEKYMNVPETANITEADIVRAYRETRDFKSIARQFCMNTNKVKGILRRAGVLEGKASVPEGDLGNIGMSEKDFYEDGGGK